jgi:ABC-type Zn2+ transport system substrate-binding protein/surface adhesin
MNISNRIFLLLMVIVLTFASAKFLSSNLFLSDIHNLSFLHHEKIANGADDSQMGHTHKHRHSENGEEHTHKHLKVIVFSEVVFSSTEILISPFQQINEVHPISYQLLISDFYLLEVLKPPIRS